MTGLNGLITNTQLAPSTRGELQDAGDLRLTGTVSTILRLEIHVRVPITTEAG